MHRRFILPFAAAGFGVVLSACGGALAGNNATAPASRTTPTTASTPTPAPTIAGSPQAVQAGATLGVMTTMLGTFIVGPDQKTLYEFDADKTSQSTCFTDCAGAWPPLTTTGAPVAAPGVMQSLLSTTMRSDGTMQVVYNGHPLYYFVGDKKPGDTTGEGVVAFGAGWDVLTPAGAKIDKGGW